MSRVQRAGRILLAMLREIFDEAPYARFLERNQLPSSRAAYKAFMQEREGNHAPRPRCC